MAIIIPHNSPTTQTWAIFSPDHSLQDIFSNKLKFKTYLQADLVEIDCRFVFCLFICLFIWLQVYMFVYWIVGLFFICLLICLFIYLWVFVFDSWFDYMSICLWLIVSSEYYFLLSLDPFFFSWFYTQFDTFTPTLIT